MRVRKSEIVDMLWRVIGDRDHARSELAKANREKTVLAKLAADEPEFYSPIAVVEALALRDRILAENARVEATGPCKSPPIETDVR